MLDNDEIVSIISSRLKSASQITNLRESLDYYLGNPLGNEIEGRSQVVSQDIGDVVEWILPQIIKNLTSTGEVVTFDPVGPEDEQQAELESFYVQDILMKKNKGFLTIHSAVKDALIQRNGIVKVYLNTVTKSNIQEAQITSEQDVILLQAAELEVLEVDEEGVALVKQSTQESKISTYAVAPENFIVNEDHNSICLQSARFQCELITKTVADWMELGYDVTEFTSSLTNEHSVYRFEAQGEQVTACNNYSDEDESYRLVTCGECYTKLDLYGYGFAQLYKVLVVLSGSGSDVSATELLSLEPVEQAPYFGTTAILMSHKFQGLSMYDRLKTLQDQMTALSRSILDNIYFTNNARHQVVPNMVDMDDMQYSVPGGLVRVKQVGAIAPIETPPIGQAAMGMLDYLQNTRTGRTGVSAEGAAQPHDVGDRVGSQGINQIMTAKEELVGLMVRVLAETLMKPVCLRIRDLSVQTSQGVPENYKMRGTWQQVNPKQWFKREATTIKCGTGSGDKTLKISALTQLIQYQQAALQVPGQTLVTPGTIFKTLDDLCKSFGLTGAAMYFVDPNSEEGQQLSQQQAQQAQQAQQQDAQRQQVELKAMVDVASAETSKAVTAQQNVALRAQIEQQSQQLDSLKQQLEALQNKDELQFKYDQLESTTALKLLELEKSAQEFEATENAIEEDDG